MIADIRLLQYKAKLLQFEIKSEAMKAANMMRIQKGQTIAYDDEHFVELCVDIETLTEELRKFEEELSKGYTKK